MGLLVAGYLRRSVVCGWRGRDSFSIHGLCVDSYRNKMWFLCVAMHGPVVGTVARNHEALVRLLHAVTFLQVYKFGWDNARVVFIHYTFISSFHIHT